jgi:hypothetical protein
MKGVLLGEWDIYKVSPSPFCNLILCEVSLLSPGTKYDRTVEKRDSTARCLYPLNGAPQPTRTTTISSGPP